MSMIKVKTAELEGAALDWAVAQVEDVETSWRYSRELVKVRDSGGVKLIESIRSIYSPSTDWSQGGQLIEKYRLEIVFDGGRHEGWRCVKDWCYGEVNDTYPLGETHLVAACRAIVAANLGAVVEVPGELVGDGQ